MDAIRIIFEKVEITCIAFTLAIAAAIILFSGDEILGKMMLSELKNDYGKFIGATFVITSAYIFVSLAYKITKFIQKLNRQKEYEKIIDENITTMTEEDVQVLSNFINFDTRKVIEVVNLNYADTRVKNLECKMLIVRLANSVLTTDLREVMFPYKINNRLKKFMEDDLSRQHK